MSLLLLPNELLFIIVEGLGTCRDISALSRTSKQLRHFFHAVLYSKTSVEDRSHALFWAASYGQAGTAQHLLDHGIDVDSIYTPWEHSRRGRERPQATALHVAVDCGYDEVACLLIERGANTLQPYGDSLFKVSVLHAACYWALPLTVQILLDRGADFTQGDKFGRTPLHFATLPRKGSQRVAGAVEIVKLLLESGADPTTRDKYLLDPELCLWWSDFEDLSAKRWASWDYTICPDRFFRYPDGWWQTRGRCIQQGQSEVDSATCDVKKVEKEIRRLLNHHATNESLKEISNEMEAIRIQREKDLAREAAERRPGVRTAIAAVWRCLRRRSAKPPYVWTVEDKECECAYVWRRKKYRECNACHQVKDILFVCGWCRSSLCRDCRDGDRSLWERRWVWDFATRQFIPPEL